MEQGETKRGMEVKLLDDVVIDPVTPTTQVGATNANAIVPDEDEHWQQEFNDKYTNCCDNFISWWTSSALVLAIIAACGLLQQLFACLCCTSRKKCTAKIHTIDYPCLLLCNWANVLVLRPVLHSAIKLLVRLGEAAVGTPLSIIAFFIDSFCCCTGSCNYTWPLFPVLYVRYKICRQLFANVCNSNLSTSQRLHNFTALVLPLSIALYLGVKIWFVCAGYLVGCPYPTTTGNGIANIRDNIDYDEVYDADDSYSLQFLILRSQPWLSTTIAYLIIALITYYSITVIWLWFKEAILRWIPAALSTTWHQIKMASVAQNLNSIRFRFNYGREFVKNHRGVIQDNYVDEEPSVDAICCYGSAKGDKSDKVGIDKISKLQICCFAIEFVLSIPSSLVTCFSDTVLSLTLYKTRNGYDRTNSPNSDEYWCCKNDNFMVPCNPWYFPTNSNSNSAFERNFSYLPMNLRGNDYASLMKEKECELFLYHDHANYKKLKLNELLVDHYLSDVAHQKVSKPILSNHFYARQQQQPQPMIFNAAWCAEITENCHVRQILERGISTRCGVDPRHSSLEQIASAYNEMIFDLGHLNFPPSPQFDPSPSIAITVNSSAPSLILNPLLTSSPQPQNAILID